MTVMEKVGCIPHTSYLFKVEENFVNTMELALEVTSIRQSPSQCGQLGEVLKLLPSPTIY